MRAGKYMTYKWLPLVHFLRKTFITNLPLFHAAPGME
jgi:hypothetical protein